MKNQCTVCNEVHRVTISILTLGIIPQFKAGFSNLHYILIEIQGNMDVKLHYTEDNSI